jgi:hypothetical protein
MLAYLFWHRPYPTTTVKFSAQCIEAVLDTLSGQDEDVGHLSFGRGHGHRGLAAEPWPRTV